MTRWARSGNTQKHKKMPQDASTWEELSEGLKKLGSIKNSKQIVVTDLSNRSATNSATCCKDLQIIKSALKKKSFVNNDSIGDIIAEKVCSDGGKGEVGDIIAEKVCSDGGKGEDPIENLESKLCSKRKKKKQKGNFDNLINSNNTILNDERETSKKPFKSFEEKKKLQKQNKANKMKDLPSELEEVKDDSSASIQQQTDTKQTKKRDIYREKLQKRRKENGITLLSPKVERRLYKIRKKLRLKGEKPEVIKSILRKERRKAELAFRKENNQIKTCFNCRKPGHCFADCPYPSNGANQETGICFKCGSLEHKSAKCQTKVSGYPFATCFICKTEGHISRECPTNKHGVYPRGGACSLCNNVNHLRKDCPTLKNKEEEATITLHTIYEGISIDDEIIDGIEKSEENKSKKRKIVKF